MKTDLPVSQRSELKSYLFAFLILLFLSNAAAAQTLTTDQSDYAPGTACTLTGTGFQAGETIRMQVLHEDYVPGDPIGEDHEPWYITADSLGSFVTTWHVCEDDCVGKTL